MCICSCNNTIFKSDDSQFSAACGKRIIGWHSPYVMGVLTALLTFTLVLFESKFCSVAGSINGWLVRVVFNSNTKPIKNLSSVMLAPTSQINAMRCINENLRLVASCTVDFMDIVDSVEFLDLVLYEDMLAEEILLLTTSISFVDSVVDSFCKNCISCFANAGIVILILGVTVIRKGKNNKPNIPQLINKWRSE